MTIKSIFFAALLRKTVATKAQRHEAKKKMHSIFLLCLGDFVAKFNFCKKLFTRRLKYLSLTAFKLRSTFLMNIFEH